MLRPLNNNVILKKEKAENKTASGIILTSVSEEKNQAVVVAVGTKCDDQLKPDMKVIFKEYSTTSFKDGEDEYLIISDEDILAIIE